MDLRVAGYCSLVLLSTASLGFFMQAEFAAGLLTEALAIVVGLIVVEPSDRTPRSGRSGGDATGR